MFRVELILINIIEKSCNISCLTLIKIKLFLILVHIKYYLVLLALLLLFLDL